MLPPELCVEELGIAAFPWSMLPRPWAQILKQQHLYPQCFGFITVQQEAVEKCSFVFVILNGLMLMTNFIHISSPTSLVVICLWFEEGLVQHIIETAGLWAQNLNMFINENIHLFSDLLIYNEQIYCLSLLFVVQGLGRGPSLPSRHWWFRQQTAKSHKINHLCRPEGRTIKQDWWLCKVCWARDFSVLMRTLF